MNNDLGTLNNRLVLIIGGTSGIGLATAKAAHSLGARVAVAARNGDELRAAEKEIGEGTAVFQIDAGRADDLRRMFEAVGKTDHLVLSASAGPVGSGSIATLDLSDLRAGFEGKFWPYVAAVQAALPHINRADGSITFVSAASAGAPLPGVAGFAAINGAIESMIPALAVEIKPVRVNAVSPGVIGTRFWQALPEGERSAMFDRYASATPVGRIGSPEDVAKAIVLLMTNQFITGTVLTVDGGLTLSPAQ